MRVQSVMEEFDLQRVREKSRLALRTIASQSVRGRAGGGRGARVRLTHEAGDFLAV